MKRFLLALVVCLGSAGYAHAGFMIEPYIGYAIGETEQAGTSADLSGINLGARVGFNMLGLMGGLDYQMGSLTSSDWSDGSADEDADSKDLGIFVGFEFPIMLRVYATYFLQSELDGETTPAVDGSGFRIGVGFTALPFVSLNVEMFDMTYDEFNGQSLGANEITTSGFMLGASLPLP